MNNEEIATWAKREARAFHRKMARFEARDRGEVLDDQDDAEDVAIVPAPAGPFVRADQLPARDDIHVHDEDRVDADEIFATPAPQVRGEARDQDDEAVHGSGAP